jgi:hypothetical protein
MSDIRPARQALLTRILHGTGQTSASERQSAFDNSGVAEPLRALIDKVAMRADDVTDQDIAAAMASGLSDDQVFEIVICAAVGQANRQYESALFALDAAAKE